MWLIAVPGLMFGTIGVLAPLRLDDLGVGAALIGAAWLVAAALETGGEPDRRARLGSPRAAVPVPDRRSIAGAVLMLLFPWPDRSWQVIALVVLAAPSIGMLWAPSMALLSDGAEAVGIAQGFAFALSNLGWSIGQTRGRGGQRPAGRRDRRTRCRTCCSAASASPRCSSSPARGRATGTSLTMSVHRRRRAAALLARSARTPPRRARRWTASAGPTSSSWGAG